MGRGGGGGGGERGGEKGKGGRGREGGGKESGKGVAEEHSFTTVLPWEPGEFRPFPSILSAHPTPLSSPLPPNYSLAKAKIMHSLLSVPGL